jgi:hypothetical protein
VHVISFLKKTHPPNALLGDRKFLVTIQWWGSDGNWKKLVAIWTNPHCLMVIEYFQLPRKGGMSYGFGKPSTYDIWNTPLTTFQSPTMWQVLNFFSCHKISNWNLFSITIYNEGYSSVKNFFCIYLDRHHAKWLHHIGFDNPYGR